jgi:hypothetical protein
VFSSKFLTGGKAKSGLPGSGTRLKIEEEFVRLRNPTNTILCPVVERSQRPQFSSIAIRFLSAATPRPAQHHRKSNLSSKHQMSSPR